MLKVCLSICVVLASAISNSHALPDFTYPDEFVTRFEACRAGFDNNTQFGTSGFTKFTVPVELDSVEKRFEAAKRIHGVFPLLGSGMRIELQSLKRNVPNRAHDYLYQVRYFDIQNNRNQTATNSMKIYLSKNWSFKFVYVNRNNKSIKDPVEVINFSEKRRKKRKKLHLFCHPPPPPPRKKKKIAFILSPPPHQALMDI